MSTDNIEDELDKAAAKAMVATNYCTSHKQYHGQKYKDCTPQERVMITVADNDAELKLQIAKVYTDSHTHWPDMKPIDWPDTFADKIMALFATHVKHLEYEKAVADNCRLVANTTGLATWTDPVTNNKLYNEAHVKQAEVRARTDEIWLAYTNHDPTTTHKDFTAYLNKRIEKLEGWLTKKEEV